MNLKSNSKVQVQGNMSSMTDMVFLLLIFFIILSTLAQNKLDVNLPSSTSTGQAESESVDIGITKENEYFIEDESGNNQILSFDEVKSYLNDEMRRSEKNDDDPTIKIHADQEAQVQEMITLLSYVKQMEWKAVIVTEQ